VLASLGPGRVVPGRSWHVELARVWRSLDGSSRGKHFAAAYAHNLSHRLPLFYLVALVDALVLLTNFFRTAPLALVVLPSLVLVFAFAIRAWHWRPAAVRRRSSAELAVDLERLPLRGLVMSSCYAAWALLLYRYGNEAQRALIHYITAITCFVGILSLGQSPRTALMLAIGVIVPSSVVFLVHDHPNRYVVVTVQVIITALLLLITSGYHRDFIQLERSRLALSRHKQSRERLAESYRQRSIRDPLTGAWNRARILMLLERGLVAVLARRPWLALIDLDGFKHINDTFGHIAGDAVLTAISDRIASVPGIESCGRMGGDEFALMLGCALDEDDVRAVLGLLARTISLPIMVQGLSLTIHASIGFYRCHGDSVSACLERADTALYKAKENRNGGAVAFNDDDERSLRERQVMTRVFTSANLREQLALVFQPIVDSDTGRPVSFEALVRWSPDGQRLLSPAKFINLAENTGRISEVTHVVLEKALREFPAWEWGCTLSVNLSAQDILRADAAEWIGGLVRNAGAPPSGVVLEVTETALLRDYQRAAENLEKLRKQGFSIALDDFGTGQSSLSHVHNLPLDQIKIDQSFAQSLTSSEGARAIVGTVVAMSRQLGLECTIEGIETVEQQIAARALGLRRMQGYLFARPASAAESRKLLLAAA